MMVGSIDRTFLPLKIFWIAEMSLEFQRWILSLVLVSGLFLVESIRFDLDSGHTRCIADEIKDNAMTVGRYHVVNPNEGHPLPDTHRVTVRVTSEYGTSYHYSDNVSDGHFAYQTVEAGDYIACFFAADHNPPVTITVDFDWKSGVTAKDWTNVAKKGSVDMMELELKKMLDTVQSIHDEMFYLHNREEEMQRLNRSTNFKMAWLSFLSLVVSLSVAAMQLSYLKSFFQKKKLI
ncbi:transmembrane emp24 domain-containing protein p24delta9-like [Andrographis paniculata]|uniref:transmembrane emp24 domain-containing protein p24delta9-like n=1 Tax=Andrographis paniculata TaxID=175694 RepID=UPI0021E6EBF4|nr:transmembrane emp24 domain-containing protein p24delta9-like [Andrographis paniculata]